MCDRKILKALLQSVAIIYVYHIYIYSDFYIQINNWDGMICVISVFSAPILLYTIQEIQDQCFIYQSKFYFQCFFIIIISLCAVVSGPDTVFQEPQSYLHYLENYILDSSYDS